MGAVELWYLRQDVSDIATRWMPHVSGKHAKRFERNVAKAQGKNSLRAFDKLTQIVDGEPRIVSDPPNVVPVEEIASAAGVDEINDAMRTVIRSTGARCRATAAGYWSASATSTRHGRWSASAASALEPGSCS